MINKKKYPLAKIKTKGRIRKIPPKIKKHLKIVTNEVTLLNHYYEVFLQFREIIKQSNVKTCQSDFWEFQNWAFTDELVHRISRLCDRQRIKKSKRVNSLYSLLEELEKHPSIINREHYLNIRPNKVEKYIKKFKDDYDFYRLNNEFSGLVGKTKFELTITCLKNDKNYLYRHTKKILNYRNKYLAHIATEKRVKTPNYNDLLSSIAAINKVTSKYFTLISVAHHTLRLPPSYISKIFMCPWIDGTPKAQALHSKFDSNRQMLEQL